MNVERAISEEIEMLKYTAECVSGKLGVFTQYHSALESLPEGVDVTVYPTSIYISSLSRDVIVEALKAFGGKWGKTKETDFYGNESIRYDQERNDGFSIRIVGEPPPSCKIVEEEVIIPARNEPEKRVMVKKIICPESDATTNPLHNQE